MIRNPSLPKLVDMVEQVAGSLLLEWLGYDICSRLRIARRRIWLG